jgi:hypothetical protein
VSAVTLTGVILYGDVKFNCLAIQLSAGFNLFLNVHTAKRDVDVSGDPDTPAHQA